LLAEKHLASFAPVHHAFDVAGFLKLLRTNREKIARSDFKVNPWSPETAPKLVLQS
jgi:hypothetical protein